MICRYGMLFQSYPLQNLNPHYPQFINNSYGTSCLYAHTQAIEAQLILCKGITFSEHLLHAHTNYNFGQTHRHKFRRLVQLGGYACISRDEITKIYARSHKMSFIHVIDAFNTTSRYLDDILNINNIYFDNMVSQIYPSELHLNKANASDTKAAFLDLHLSISNNIVSTKIYDKRDDFDFEIVNFPFLDGDVTRSTSYGVYISQLIRFARASSYVADFNTRTKLLTQKLLKQGYRYHKLRKTFFKIL